MATAQPVGERPAWVDDELFPFESRFVEIDGSLVHYVDEGSGPTLLYHHGPRSLVRARSDVRPVAVVHIFSM